MCLTKLLASNSPFVGTTLRLMDSWPIATWPTINELLLEMSRWKRVPLSPTLQLKASYERCPGAESVPNALLRCDLRTRNARSTPKQSPSGAFVRLPSNSCATFAHKSSESIQHCPDCGSSEGCLGVWIWVRLKGKRFSFNF